MDLATIIGIVASFGLIIGSMLLGGTLDAFWNLPGVMIVFGGTITATFVAYRMGDVLGSIKVAMHAFMDKSPSVPATAAQILELSTKVRKEDLLALESVQIDDVVLGKAVRMAVDGVDLDTIRTTLRAELASMIQRHQVGRKTFQFMCSTAPSMGMIGTLIGLVQMLGTLDDPSAIGPAMAVALLTTLYGAVLAFVVFGPIANKLEIRTDVESINLQVIIEGIGAIANGENAAIVQEKLDAYLPPSDRKAGGGGDG